MTNYRNRVQAPWALKREKRLIMRGQHNYSATPGWKNPKIKYAEGYTIPKIDMRGGAAGYRDQLRVRMANEIGLFTPWQSLNVSERRLLDIMTAADRRESRRRSLRIAKALGITTRLAKRGRGRYWHRHFEKRCKREGSFKWFTAIP